MKCQRCLSGEEARYLAYSDIMKMKVCGPCAEEARKLGIVVEVLDRGKRKSSVGMVTRKIPESPKRESI